jgi:hypothetical protein
MRYISNEARTLSAIGFMMAILSVATCLAEPQHYSETIDFSDTPEMPTALSIPLGLGTNTITGSADPGFGFEQDKDFFEVRVPSGSILTDISVTITDYGPAGSDLGAFSLIPTTQGKLDIVTNGTFQLPFSLENERNIQFLAESPVDIGAFSFGSFNYTVSLIIEKDVPAISLNSTGMLSWNSVTGQVYQVQWTEQLTTNSWNNLGGAITASTDIITIHDDIAGVDQRFYRIRTP